MPRPAAYHFYNDLANLSSDADLRVVMNRTSIQFNLTKPAQACRFFIGEIVQNITNK